jgi:excisionase family DNA binding protein
MDSQILTIEELSAYLKISRFTIYDWVYHKRIPYLKLGRYLRFKKELIDEWIEKKLRLPFELPGNKLYNKKDETTAGSDERSCL